jgi:quinol monooxygenase YgiN
MIADRRTFLEWLTTAAVAVTPVLTGPQGEHLMYGLIAKLTAVTGKRDELIQVLKEGTRNMPGCRSYIVARNAVDENILWVTEICDSETSHDASLSLPAVKDTVAQAKPLVAGFEKVAVTNPVGGLGFPSSP